MASAATSLPPAAASVRSVLIIKQSPPAPCHARSVLRIRPSAALAPEEDATLARLAGEHGCHHWRRVAECMPGRSSRQCRDRWRHHIARAEYYRPFTVADDEELARLFMRHAGRWSAVSHAAHRRTSRVMRRRWKEIRDTDALLGKLWRPTKQDAECNSSTTSLQLQCAGVDDFGSGLPCFSHGRHGAATMSLPPACVAVA